MDEPTVSKLRELLAREPDVACALLFGSRARGEHGPDSDVDLAVRGLHLDRLGLAARLSLALDLEVDVVDLDTATIPLLRDVLKDGVPIASNTEGALGAFYSRALTELENDGPLYDHMAAAYIASLAARSLPW